MFDAQIRGGIGIGTQDGDEWEGWATFQPFQDGLLDLQRAALANRGRALLGYELVPESDRPSAPFDWLRSATPQLAGLPVDVCGRAMDAAAATDAAALVFIRAEERVNQWAQINRPSPELLKLKREELTIEQHTAYARATDVLVGLCVELATAAGDLARIRSALAAIPDRIRQRRADCVAAEQADMQAERDLRAQLASYRLTE